MLLLARDDGLRPCRALVRGSATNQNSRRRPMTAVDPTAQERVIRAACADGGIEPSEVAVVECHGTGTRLGDPIEVEALGAAALAEFDEAKRNEILTKMNDTIMADAPELFIVHDLNPRALSPKLSGFVQAQSWFQDLTPVVMK